jgi:hypothetical protein
MEKVLRKFREFMREEYRHKDDKFYETNGRLLFLAYLRPIINGRGFALVEPETRDNRRMDIVVTYGDEKFIIELKLDRDAHEIEDFGASVIRSSCESPAEIREAPLWNGPEYEQKGLLQLAEYLNIQSMDTGWLITFGLGKMADAEPEWVKTGGKDIFKVIV